MPKHLHRLSNINTELARADCAGCNANVEIKWKPHRSLWVCREKLRSDARKSVRVDERRGTWRSKANARRVEIRTKLLKDQDSCCAICNRFLVVPVLDHCHTTGYIRAVLCSNCNTALGLLREDPEIMAKAINYLTFHAERGDLNRELY